jgi:UDP-glucose 4-epimerase
MKTVVVTGGAGFIGTPVKRSRRPASNQSLLTIYLEAMPISCAGVPSLRAIFSAALRSMRPSSDTGPAAAIHFAALADVGESISRQLAYYRIHAAMVQELTPDFRARRRGQQLS